MSTAEPTAKLQQILNQGAAHSQRTRWRGGLILVAVLLVAGWAYLSFGGKEDADLPRYRTESATLGSMVVRVSATGNLQPTNQVDVGSELSGIVEQVLVDDNDHVTKGQELVRLDLTKLQDTVAKSRANLSLAEAQVLQAGATVLETRAQRARMQQVAKLSGGKVPSKSELDSAEANLKRAEAGEAVARASVTQAQASLRSDETNLAKAHIRSPINGVVLARKVEPGQTVAASLQAPVLFTLAEDLAKMELQVNVDEADVGRVQAGQQATFGVDAWPNRRYHAVITRVSFGSQTINGVVSYPTTLEVKNDDLSLRPGMTGTAEITALTRQDVLLVPNAALRFTPPPPDKASKGSGRGLVGILMPRPNRNTARVRDTPRGGGKSRVWVLQDGQAVPVEVEVGVSDGKRTEIVAGSLQPGTPVITESMSNAP